MMHERDQFSQFFGVRTTNSPRFLSLLLSSQRLLQREYLLSLYDAEKLTGYPPSPCFSFFLLREMVTHVIFSIEIFSYHKQTFFLRKIFTNIFPFLEIFFACFIPRKKFSAFSKTGTFYNNNQIFI